MRATRISGNETMTRDHRSIGSPKWANDLEEPGTPEADFTPLVVCDVRGLVGRTNNSFINFLRGALSGDRAPPGRSGFCLLL